jgi:hypothetical protein
LAHRNYAQERMMLCGRGLSRCSSRAVQRW